MSEILLTNLKKTNDYRIIFRRKTIREISIEVAIDLQLDYESRIQLLIFFNYIILKNIIFKKISDILFF